MDDSEWTAGWVSKVVTVMKKKDDLMTKVSMVAEMMAVEMDDRPAFHSRRWSQECSR